MCGILTSVYNPTLLPLWCWGHSPNHFIYTGRAQSCEWVDHGFKLHIIQDALPPEVDECWFHVKVSISDQFQFPEDTELISGIYWKTTHHKFAKPVTAEIQHLFALCLVGDHWLGSPDTSDLHVPLFKWHMSLPCSSKSVWTYKNYSSVKSKQRTPKWYWEYTLPVRCTVSIYHICDLDNWIFSSVIHLTISRKSKGPCNIVNNKYVYRTLYSWQVSKKA